VSVSGYYVYNTCLYTSDLSTAAGSNVGKYTKYTSLMGVESSAVTSAVDASQSYYIVYFNEAYTVLATTGRTYTSRTVSLTPITD